MTKDMTKGNPLKLIIAFAVPLIAGNLFQLIYSMADTYLVGRFLGEDALAAVGSTGGMSFLAVGFVLGITSGFSVLIAQRFGAGDEDGVRKVSAMAILLSIVFTVILTLACAVSVKFLLNIMNTTQTMYQNAYDYIYIIYVGIGASIFYNLLAGILRALGDSKTPLYFLIVSSVLNIILDIVFIRYVKLGVAGAAYATVLAQVISGVLCLVYMFKKFEILRFKASDFKIDWQICYKHLYIAIPMALQFSIIAIGSIILQSAINPLGTKIVAAYTAADKVQNIIMLPLSNIGVTMATFTAQNLGAGNISRIKEGVSKSTILGIACSVIGAIIFFVFGRQFSAIFFENPTQMVIDNAYEYLCISAVFLPFLSVLFIYRNTLQGMGNSVVPVIAGISELVMRALVAFLLVAPLGFVGVALAGPLAWIGAALPLGIMYFVNIKRLSNEIDSVN